ncbi:MAG: autotransporter-associated beta strand repeat-containing protein [Verrucomicrobia bacterium]|nr:autotransporter-associated beta strand repeat-containing protein [Verrucomicrobiota bacterium]
MHDPAQTYPTACAKPVSAGGGASAPQWDAATPPLPWSWGKPSVKGMLLKLQDTIRAWATSSGAALALGILWAGSNLASGALTPEQQDFANQLNAGRFLTIRATGKNYTTPANYEGVYSGTYDTTASANSPWLLTGLLKAGFVILTGVDGGLIGDTVNEKWGDRGCAIGLAAGTVVVAAANVAIPLSPTYVHDAELFGAIEVAGQGDILPTVTANAELFIDATVALPGLGPTISISFIDLSAVFGQVVDQFGVPIPGSSLSAFLFEDSSDNSRLFGVLATNDINQSGRPLAFTDRYKIEMENVYPGVADGTSVTVKSTLLVANAQLDCTYSAVTWTGAASPTWDINTTHNWSKSGAPAVFNNSDPVLFDDFSANWAVALAVPVQPGSVTVNSNLDYTFSGASIGGTGCAITKLGMGMLTLLNANTYGGGTSIYAGTVQLGNGGTSGSLTGNILNDGALVFNRSSTVTFPGIISGSGVVTKAGPGNSTLVLTGSSTHTGGTIISAGTLRLGSGGTTGWIAGNINNFGSLVFNRSNAVTFPGIIGGLGTVTKAGAGTLTLTGPNTYTGTTVVSTGTLLVDGSIGGGGTVSVNANCTLGGTGTIGGQVMIPLNGFLRPGHGGIGTLTTGSLTLAGTYACELDGTSGDRIAAADLNLNGATLAIATLSPPGAPSYEIATYTGTRTGTFATVTGLPSGYVIDYSSVGQVRLVMAGPSSVIYAGLVHTSRGSATMEVLANQLLVSNLGSSGQDGVTIALAANSLAWGAQWAALDTGGVLPVGAALRAQVTGTGGPVINGTLGTMQVTKAGNANYVMGADLSPLGVNSVTVLVYNGADLMAQATFATPGGIFTNLGVSTLAPTSGALTWPPSRPWPRPWPPWPHPWPPWPEPWPPFPWPEPGPLVMTWHGPTATFTLSTGDSVVGDTFVVIPEVTYGAITTSAIQVLAAQIPSLTITRETVSLEYAGLAHTSLGDATLNVTNNQLVVANLGGSSGEDGVEMALSSDLTAWEAHWQDLDPSGMLPVGAYLKQQVIGTGGTVTDGVLGIVQVTKAGSGIFLISADFSPLGSNTRTVQVYRGHTLVAEVTGQSGALCATSVSISGSASVGWWPLYVDVDRVVMIPEGAAAPTLPLTVQLTASQIPSITITSEDKTLEYAGLAHTSMGNAVLDGIDNKLLVANLGTNGNDGVEIALPAKLSAWEAHWQDLDPGGMLPVGAYLRQQVIGTGGTVTDGVLGTVQVTKAGSGNYLISADFSPLGSSTRTVQVYRGSTLVAQVTGQSGALCATSVSISGSASVGWWPLYVDRPGGDDSRRGRRADLAAHGATHGLTNSLHHHHQ